MTFFGSIWLIALAWCFLQGSFSLNNLLLGTFLGIFILCISLSFSGMYKSFNQLKAVLNLILYILKELIISSIRISWDILTPTVYARPRIVRIPIDDLHDVAITILANAISLTPGSLALEVNDNHQFLYVHLMYAEDRDAAVNAIYIDLGNRVRKVFGINTVKQ